MAKNIKYVPSGGLLLDENEDINKLSKLAKEGQILESFEKLLQKLRKGDHKIQSIASIIMKIKMIGMDIYLYLKIVIGTIFVHMMHIIF